jgi:hypothetical protein
MASGVEEKFKVMEGRFNPVIGHPAVILTGSNDPASEYIQGEWFYIIDFNGLEVVKGMHLRAHRDLPIAKDIETFWRRELVDHVETALFYEEVYPRIKDHADYFLFDYEPQLRDVDETLLFHIQNRNIFFVDSVYQLTENDALRRYLLSLDGLKLECRPYAS